MADAVAVGVRGIATRLNNSFSKLEAHFERLPVATIEGLKEGGRIAPKCAKNDCVWLLALC